MQNIKDLYVEMAEKAAAIDGINWVDLWHNQVNFLEDEFPFNGPAFFMQFIILQADDIGNNVQMVRVQMDGYLFYETMADTSRGSMNRESALDFLDLLNGIFAAFHGSSGENYSNMRRVGFSPVDTGNAGNLYKVTFTCECVDYGAMRQTVEGAVSGVVVANEKGPETEPDNSFFIMP